MSKIDNGSSDSQVIIVGSGPTGATLALVLVQRGISVTLIEAAKDFERVFRGEGLMPSGLQALEEMGILPLLDQIPHRPLAGWEFILNGQSLFQVEEPMGANRPCTLVTQPPLLTALVAQAKTYPGFEFISGVAVKDLLWNDDEADEKDETRGQPRVGGVVLADGQERRATLVIGADGRHSMVRSKAGLELLKKPKDITVLWFKLPAHPQFVAKNIFYSVLSGNHSFSVFHGACEHQLHLGWVLTEEQEEDWKHQNWGEIFAKASPAWLARHFREVATEIEPPIRLSVMVGRAPRWQKPGLLLLGDAAHPMSPIRAQGINMALRDVVVAANHLVPILSNCPDVAVDLSRLDQALIAIQAEREPEIIRAQELQDQEGAQGQALRGNRWRQIMANLVAPLIRKKIRQAWIERQQPMRLGITDVKLSV